MSACLKRNVKVPCKEMKAAVYWALVCRHLEYASLVWDPPPSKDRKTKGLVDRLEMVQCSATLLAGSSETTATALYT